MQLVPQHSPGLGLAATVSQGWGHWGDETPLSPRGPSRGSSCRALVSLSRRGGCGLSTTELLPWPRAAAPGRVGAVLVAPSTRHTGQQKSPVSGRRSRTRGFGVFFPCLSCGLVITV